MPLLSRTIVIAYIAAILVLAGCQTTTRLATEHSGSARPALTVLPVAIYVAQTHPGTGLNAVPVTNGTIYLEGTPVLTRADITDASALSNHLGQHFVGLRFTTVGAQKIAAASQANKGGMLALVIGRELVAAPRLDRELDRGTLTFETPSAAIAASLAARVRGDAP